MQPLGRNRPNTSGALARPSVRYWVRETNALLPRRSTMCRCTYWFRNRPFPSFIVPRRSSRWPEQHGIRRRQSPLLGERDAHKDNSLPQGMGGASSSGAALFFRLPLLHHFKLVETLYEKVTQTSVRDWNETLFSPLLPSHRH